METTTHHGDVSVIGREGEPTGASDIMVSSNTGYGRVLLNFVHAYDEEGDPYGAELAPEDARQLATLLLTAADSAPFPFPLKKWSEMFPNGRDIYYEGDDPQGFCAEIRFEFGFDPSADRHWGLPFQLDDGTGFHSYGFHCPPGILDAVYGSDRWMLGS